MTFDKAVPKVICNWMCTPINKSIRNILLKNSFGCVRIITGYFLFKKQALKGLLKVMGIQTTAFEMSSSNNL